MADLAGTSPGTTLWQTRWTAPFLGARRQSTLATGDELLAKTLGGRAEDNRDFWTFAKRRSCRNGHGLYQYPAMMVPDVLRELLASVMSVQPHIRSVLDPFAGSGTIIGASMAKGLDVAAQDINPLAVLMCQVRSGPFHEGVARRRADRTLKVATTTSGARATVSFARREKWFRPRALEELSQLRQAIRAVQERWMRRVLWLCLAETVRRTSNSRTSTYKLHIRTPEDLARTPWPLDTFAQVAERNVNSLAAVKRSLRSLGVGTGRKYPGSVCVRLRDSRKSILGQHDLMITSPPYGDNTSTVPYGQNAYLPLQWIDLDDISPNATREFLSSTYEIDRRSLGGVKLCGSIEGAFGEVLELSPALRAFVRQVARSPRDRSVRVLAFLRDLDATLLPILGALRPNAYMLWTLGNRRVGGVEVPLDRILMELLVGKGVAYVTKLKRRIPQKRVVVQFSCGGFRRGC